MGSNSLHFSSIDTRTLVSQITIMRTAVPHILMNYGMVILTRTSKIWFSFSECYSEIFVNKKIWSTDSSLQMDSCYRNE